MSLASVNERSPRSFDELKAGVALLDDALAPLPGKKVASPFDGLAGPGRQNDDKSSKVTTGTQAYTPGAPTRAQLQDAAADAYTGATPTGMRPFRVNGRQMILDNEITGAAAKAWITPQNKIVIAYEGTAFEDPGTLLADVGIAARVTTPGEIDSLNFARSVMAQAKAQGYSSGDVFVTGHSLGGTESEFVASRTGLGGASFNGTGLPVSQGQADGRNFTSYIRNGDPVSSYASDVRGLQPFAPPYVPGGGSLPHYGHLVTEGDPSAQAEMARNVRTFNIPGLIADLAKYHQIENVAVGTA